MLELVTRRSKQLTRNKRWILLVASLVIILTGFWFSSTNLYKFTKGYFIYKTTAVSKPAPTEKRPTHEASDKKLYPVRPKTGEKIGDLSIPKLAVTLPIYHGTDEDELEKGIGHYAESVLPGESDNSVLAGHRDTVFRKLGEVGVGDLLIVTTAAGEFKYKVNKVRIVDKDDRTVIVPKPRATLTVSTCYPFHYIGSAPKRYILVAYLVSQTLRTS